jgi:hypothetical protein
MFLAILSKDGLDKGTFIPLPTIGMLFQITLQLAFLSMYIMVFYQRFTELMAERFSGMVNKHLKLDFITFESLPSFVDFFQLLR